MIVPACWETNELASLGADGMKGGSEEDADITSWAEASLIGR